jgi:hypothetical protein
MRIHTSSSGERRVVTSTVNGRNKFMGDVTHVTVNHPTMSDTRTPAPLEVVFYHFATAKQVA